MLYDCLIKTQHSAKKKYQSIECDVCPVSVSIIYLFWFLTKILKYTPI